MHFGGQLLDSTRQIVHPLAEQGTGHWRVLAEQVQLDGQECQALVQVVVQLKGDASAFRFLGQQQPAGQRSQLEFDPPTSPAPPVSDSPVPTAGRLSAGPRQCRQQLRR